MRRILSIFLFAALFGKAFIAVAADQGFGLLEYGAGKTFQTGVYKPKLHAELPVPNNEPFLLFSGLGCDECDINLSIYLRSPTQGKMQEGEQAPRYSYPGTYRDYLSGELVQSVRMFYGRCTLTGRYGVIWFANTKLETKKWQQSTYLLEIDGASLVQVPQPPAQMTIKTALAAEARHVCRELPGKQFNTEP